MARWTPPHPERFGQIPRYRGLVFQCLHCGWHTAVCYDTALRTWGEQGIIEDVARRTRCSRPKCLGRGKRGHQIKLAPVGADLGSKKPLPANDNEVPDDPPEKPRRKIQREQRRA